MEFIIVSGLSGAGKSTVISILEDSGFFCVDNLPPVLIPKFAELCLAGTGAYERVFTRMKELEAANKKPEE